MKKIKELSKSLLKTSHTFLKDKTKKIYSSTKGKLFDKNRNVAVIGMPKSGKTVFLTSLIDHLKYNNEFCVDKNERLNFISEKSNNTFDYKTYKEDLIEHYWPYKTKVTSDYKCKIKYGKNIYNLGLYDMPGDIFFDFDMHILDYKGWSESIISQYYKQGAKTFEYIKPYIDCLKNTASPEELIITYKKCLLNLIRECAVLNISPCSFKISKRDDEISMITKDMTEEEVLEKQICGIENKEFVPIPEKYWDTYKKTIKLFSKNYDYYKKYEVSQAVNNIYRCDTIVFFLDILRILEDIDKEKFFNKNVEFVEEILRKIIKPDNRFLRNLKKGFIRSKIKKIIFVAPKTDLVYETEINNFNSLLYDFIKTCNLSDLKEKKINIHQLLISSLISTEKTEKKIFGRVKQLGDKIVRENGEFIQGHIPANWPSSDDWGDYAFFNVYPNYPKRFGEIPKQHNLDKVFKYIKE